MLARGSYAPRAGAPSVQTAHEYRMTDPRTEQLISDLDLGDETPRPRSDTLERPHINGSLPKETYVAYARDLTPADIAALSMPAATVPRTLVRIHSSHHALAKCIATGMKPAQAALVTGYSPGRITALMRDESFTALVADYKSEAQSVFADLAERMNAMSLDAIELLHERLMDNPETFTVPVLLDIVKTMADRTGHGPGQEVRLKVDQEFIDRPPRETFDEWKERRARELQTGDSVEPTAGTSDGGNNRRLVQ